MGRRKQVRSACLDKAHASSALNAHGIPSPDIATDYVVVVDSSRRYVEVSSGFCKLLGYTESELLGQPYDRFSVPGTNYIPTVLELFLKSGYMHGLWVFAHKNGTKILVRYEAFIRLDGLYECHMELLGAGA
jgi:PAS domain-containing protein